MNDFPISIVSPAGSDKALAKSYSSLAAEAGELRSRRKTATAHWQQLNQRQHQARPAEAAALAVEKLELEISLLEKEIPLMERVPAYLRAAHDYRRRERSIAEETIRLAQQAVVAEFHRAFDPAKWRINEAGLAHLVTTHPIVRGAREHFEELANGEPEAEAHRSVTISIVRAKPHLDGLKQSLEVAKGRAKQLQEAAAEEETRRAEQAQENARRQAAIETSQRKAADEARRRLQSGG